jgi:hypothetical protein
MYWGGTIAGDVYGIGEDAPANASVLQRFENDAGKNITFVNTGQAWGKFDERTMNAAISEGAIPLVSMWLESSHHRHAPARPARRDRDRPPVHGPGPGTLELSGDGIHVRLAPSQKAPSLTFSKYVPRSGRLVLEVIAAGRMLRSLKANGEVSAALSLRFSPLGGEPRSRRIALTLHRAATGHAPAGD